MLVEIIRATIAQGQPVFENEVVDLPDHVALALISAGKAREAKAQKRGRKKAVLEAPENTMQG